MRLPEELSAVIQQEIEKVSRPELVRAASELTRRYKAADFSAPVIRSQSDRAVYLALRLPATYAVNCSVFSEVQRLSRQGNLETILDLGAGPGAALLAAARVFPGLRQATLIESDADWLAVGKRLAGHSPNPLLRHARWIRQDLRAELDCSAHDMVVISYSLGELAPPDANALLRRAWRLTTNFLVIIEPGTPRGFTVVHSARSALIAEAAAILAPCPHDEACPMAAAGDWCHFAQRITRTSLHRQLKGAALGYEDEKFSYVVATRHNATSASSRIIRHPQKRSGHVQLTLCTRHGLETRTVSRSQGEDYRRARQADWGEAWDE